MTKNSITAKEYQELASRTLIGKPDFEISDDKIMVIWNAIGLAGEASEGVELIGDAIGLISKTGKVTELVKKGVFHQHGLNREKLAKELGDCLWYVAALCTKLDLDMAEIMQDNVEKLMIRYPDGYSSDASQRRVDIAGPIVCRVCSIQSPYTAPSQIKQWKDRHWICWTHRYMCVCGHVKQSHNRKKCHKCSCQDFTLRYKGL